MAIKIIKHGTKVFRETCPVCGCEFEYEYEDLIKEYGFVKMIKCPDCGEMIPHREFREPKFPIYPDIEPVSPIIKPYVTWDTTDCEKCPNYHYLKSDKLIIGDTPCSLCRKNQPYCTSVSSSAAKLEFATSAADSACASYSDALNSNDNKIKEK